MTNRILPTGYETQVRTDMGVKTSILPDTDIQSKATLAEAIIIQKVPGYAEITGDELTFLQSATVSQLCALLCLGMPNRVKIQQADETLYSFKLQAVDWQAKKKEFEGLVQDYLFLATGSEIEAFNPLGVTRGVRDETGSYPR